MIEKSLVPAPVNLQPRESKRPVRNPPASARGQGASESYAHVRDLPADALALLAEADFVAPAAALSPEEAAKAAWLAARGY